MTQPGESDESLSASRIIVYERDSLPATRRREARLRRAWGVGPFFRGRISADDHLRIESSKSYTSKATWGQSAKAISKSGRILQSCVCALSSPGVRDGDDTGDPLASRELDDVPPHLHDLRDGSCRSQYRPGCVCAGFGHYRLGDCCRGNFSDLPLRYYPVYSSSTCALIPRPIQ